ncbi:MAG: restriction endonuclease subunit S [Candidatus Jordarchaeaceae archaeon]
MNKIEFYKETNLKEDSEVGRIPIGWEIRKVADLFTVETGTTPSTKNPEYWEAGDVNWFTPLDLSKLNGKIRIRESERKITRKALKEYNLTLMPPGSLILSTRAPVGYVAVLEEGGTFNQGCKGLILRDKEVESLFYAYYLLHKKDTLQNLSGGSTFKELSKTMLENVKVPLPPVEEQKAVAWVLSVVDLAIQRTDMVIAKTERLKKGLMQTLLTKGIGHKEYKVTEIERIPKEWEVVRLRDVVNTKKGKKPEKLEEEWKENYLPYLTADYFRTGKPKQFVKLEAETSYITVGENDVIFIWDGSNAGDVFTGLKGVLASTMVVINPKENLTLTKQFLFYFMKTKFELFNSKTTGSTIPHVSKSLYENLLIPLPPLPEQQKIAEILSTIDKKLELEKKRKEKLERIKKGLMNDLLTGKRRIPQEMWEKIGGE